jgi:hypothetical protein
MHAGGVVLPVGPAGEEVGPERAIARYPEDDNAVLAAGDLGQDLGRELFVAGFRHHE